MYRETTSEVTVEVLPSFLPDHSDPDRGIFVFSYEITITNESRAPAKLVSRHWIIRDGAGGEREVKGDGVVGEQPRLLPGAVYAYSSFCPLPTPTGSMRGSFRMERDDGTPFEVKIPLFFLRDLPSYH